MYGLGYEELGLVSASYGWIIAHSFLKCILFFVGHVADDVFVYSIGQGELLALLCHSRYVFHMDGRY